MNITMNFQKLSLLCLLAFAILGFYGCTNESDSTAVSLDGVEISFDKQGSGKPALVLIHGWSNNKSIWDKQVSHFSEKYTVVAIDLAGFGESGNNRHEWTIPAFSDDVYAVIHQLKLKEVVLVGISMGAPVVVQVADVVPEKVAGVVIVDYLHDVEMQYPPPVISYMDSMMMDLVNAPTIEKTGYFFRNNIEESYARVEAMLAENPKIGWSESLHGMFQWLNEDCTAILASLEVPLVAINSDQVPTNVEAMQKYVPSFEAKIIPDVGHVLMWDATEEFNNLLEESIQGFLKE